MTDREASLIARVIEDVVEGSLEQGLWDTGLAISVVRDLLAMSPKIRPWLEQCDQSDVKKWLRHCFGDSLTP